MPWPFRRRRSKPAVSLPEPVLDTAGFPVIIPADINETIVTGILQRAQEQSKDLASGEIFTVAATDEELQECGNPVLLAAPVFMRAQEFGLLPEWTYNGEFAFSKM